MGCSPSHSGIIQSIAKNAAKPLKKNKAILPPDQNGITIPLVGNKNSGCQDSGGKVSSEASKEGDESDPHTCHQEKGSTRGRHSTAENVPLPDDRVDTQGSADESMVNLRYQKGERRKHSSTGSEFEFASDVQRGGNVRRSRKSKSQRSNKQGRRSKAKEKQNIFSETEKKVDFPEPLVKAHQSAYSYLNPNISKFEAVISMANQATQTQLIMQQMTSFTALRFDEINQCLKEIADDGEKLLKDFGNDLIWPLGKGNPVDQPDLLQQLLQYTVNRMHMLNSTVASLTSNALQETCSYLQSAAASMQEKLKVKQMCDERLSRMIKLLEDSAAGSIQSHPNDLTLYSEDSGIGGDNESLKECKSPDKQERRTSHDSSGNIGTNQSQQEAANRNIKGESITHQTILGNRRVGTQSSLATSLSMNSLDSSTTLEQDSNNDQESEESTSSVNSDDDDEEDDKSISSLITLHQRPMTSPAGAGAFKHSPKWLENPENEEMTLKMKEAISEKIKFVPDKSNSNVWIREEEVLARPSTADGSDRRTSRHRRTRSAESLRSQTEDPTLIELQRTQKELDRKLQLLYKTSNTTNAKLKSSEVKSFSHTKCIVSGNNTSTSKLKACLDKSFNILPSQERLALVGCDKRPETTLSLCSKTTVIGTTPQLEHEKSEEKITLVERKLDSLNVSPRQSVRKLIETFSPADDPPKVSGVKLLGPLRCVRKFGVPVLPPTIPAYRGLEPLDHKSHIPSTDGRDCRSVCKPVAGFTCKVWEDMVRPDTTETSMEDLENLPPPPPEILMDDSFNVLQTKEPEKDTQKSALEFLPSDSSFILKKMGAFQKMKASVKVIDLLPSKNGTSMDKTLKSQEDKTMLRTSTKESDQQFVTHGEKERGFEMQRKHEIEQAAHLYKQSHKIIPLQNPGGVGISSNDGENKVVDGQCLYKQKQCWSTSRKGSEKSPTSIRKASPTRAVPSSSEKMPSSPPTHRAIIKSHYNVQSSPPPAQRNTNPVNSPKVPSPPTQRKLPSPPSQRKLQSPPQIRRQGSPPSLHRQTSPQGLQKPASPPSQPRQRSPQGQQKPASPPSQCRQSSPQSLQKPASPPSQPRQTSPQGRQKTASPPSHRRLPSPPSQQRLQSPPNGHRLPSPPGQPTPSSPRRLPSPPSAQRGANTPSHYTTSPPVSPSHNGLRRNSDEPLPSSKIFGNAQSIFCPSSTSLFEAKVPSPPNISGTDVASTQASAPQLRHSFSGRLYGNHHRVATSAANPQPFVRRCYSDRRPRVQLRLPAPIPPSCPSESSPQNAEPEESTQKESDHGIDLKAPSPTPSHPALCVVGQGFQKEQP